MNRMELILDDDDYGAIQDEITRRQLTDRPLPEGESNLAGAMIGEMVRDLVEYRQIWEAEHQ